MRKVLRQHHISFQNAFAGLTWALRSQPNFRVHTILSLLALALAWYFRITQTEWAIIIFTIVLGFIVEMINTALESMTDLITTEWRAEAKVAKDVAAGMMLLTALGAVSVAMVVFGPYILTLWNFS
jgi:diacylglycerol kinase